MRKQTTVTENVVVGTFDLQLPDICRIEPAYTVALPGNHTALIFRYTENVRRVIQTKDGGTAYIDVAVEGYRYLVRKQDGRQADPGYRVGDWRGAFYESPLMLKLALEADALSLAPKRRERREVDERD